MKQSWEKMGFWERIFHFHSEVETYIEKIVEIKPATNFAPKLKLYRGSRSHRLCRTCGRKRVTRVAWTLIPYEIK